MATDQIANYIAVLIALQVALIVLLGVQILLRLRRRGDTRREFAEMARAARLALTGEVTAQVAHKITQPLSAILCNVEAADLLLRQENPDIGAVREILADVSRDDLRANRIVDGLRMLIDRRELHLERVDVNALTAQVLSLVLPEAIRSKVAVRSTLAPELPHISADPQHLQQVLLNLVNNALDAMRETPPDARCLDIRTEYADEQVKVAVLDSGCGLDPDRTERIFDSFFTTKNEGLGLGLSLARSIIRMHGGAIWAENRASGGAAFMFTVPLRR